MSSGRQTIQSNRHLIVIVTITKSIQKGIDSFLFLLTYLPTERLRTADNAANSGNVRGRPKAKKHIIYLLTQSKVSFLFMPARIKQAKPRKGF